jgi:hypothetical protein
MDFGDTSLILQHLLRERNSLKNDDYFGLQHLTCYNPPGLTQGNDLVVVA